MVLGDRLLSAKLAPTIDGASILAFDVWDGDRSILNSGAFGTRAMSKDARVSLDGISYTIAGISRAGTTLSFSCEETIVTQLKRDGRTKPVRQSRGKVTRAHFCAQLIRRAGYPVIVLDENRVQPIAREVKRARSSAATKRSRASAQGIQGTGLKIKGEEANSEQRRQVQAALTVCAEERAGAKATLALMCAGIGESGFQDVPNSAGSPYGGVFQARKTLKLTTAQQARSFLRGENGFQQGGAIKLARQQPNLTPGDIATRVEASGEAGGFYNKHRAEAQKWIEAFGGANSAVYKRVYAFERKRGESTWTACKRLLDEVNWRMFVREGVVVIASDTALMRAEASLVFGKDTEHWNPDFEWHRALRVGEMTGRVAAARYQADPGEVVQVLDLPPIEDRWLLASSTVDLLSRVAPVELRLRRPQDPKKEPEAERQKVGGDGGLRDRIVHIAESSMTSKTGHRYYSQSGAPNLTSPTPKSGRSDCSQWVAAVYHKAGAPFPGGNTWEQSRKGKRTSKPKPGDLMMAANTEHVELYVGKGRTIGHGSSPIDYANVSNFPGHYFVTYDFLDNDD